MFDDTEFVLNELSKRYDLYLISNIATPYKECFYNLGLDRWIKDPIFSCDVGYSKPDPNIFKIVIEKSGLQPGQLLMIGDWCDHYIVIDMINRSRFSARIPHAPK